MGGVWEGLWGVWGGGWGGLVVVEVVGVGRGGVKENGRGWAKC